MVSSLNSSELNCDILQVELTGRTNPDQIEQDDADGRLRTRVLRLLLWFAPQIRQDGVDGGLWTRERGLLLCFALSPDSRLPFSPSRAWFPPFSSRSRGLLLGERGDVPSETTDPTPRRQSGRLVAFVREEASSSAGSRFAAGDRFGGGGIGHDDVAAGASVQAGRSTP